MRTCFAQQQRHDMEVVARSDRLMEPHPLLAGFLFGWKGAGFWQGHGWWRLALLLVMAARVLGAGMHCLRSGQFWQTPASWVAAASSRGVRWVHLFIYAAACLQEDCSSRALLAHNRTVSNQRFNNHPVSQLSMSLVARGLHFNSCAH